jgi:hypothetical protein
MSAVRFELRDLLTKAVVEVPTEVIQSHFSLPYCCTVHASQGRTLPGDGALLIADWQHASLVNASWFYAAITRIAHLDRVLLLDAATRAGNGF